MTDFWKKIKHFEKEEFACKCGCGSNIMSRDFVKMLDIARGYANTPFNINSACRCPAHNKKENGFVTSSHLVGYAVDIEVLNSVVRHKIVVALLGVGFNRIGIYEDFIHVDVDLFKTKNVLWYE